ncbi:MAG: hypothetical protein DYH06_00640 [Acidobacteria bacterium ACB2]|nr:hypothetical protein [Acidobacteria bacterium ACB2]
MGSAAMKPVRGCAALEAELARAEAEIAKARAALRAIGGKEPRPVGARVTRHSRDMVLALAKAEAALKKAKKIAAKVTRHSRDLAVRPVKSVRKK